MPRRRSMAFALVGLMASAACSMAQDDPITTLSRAAQEPLNVLNTAPPEVPIPPLLPAPPNPVANPAPMPNPVYQGHAYMPEVNPNGRPSMCALEYRHPSRLWATAAPFIGITADMGNIKREETYGVRLGAGYWFDDYRTLGVDLSFLNTHDSYSTFAANLARLDAPLTLTTGDINVRAHLLEYDRYRLDGLVGYRALGLRERFNSFGGGPTVLSESSNTVHAFQVGAVGDYRFGPYFGELGVKLGAGTNRQRTTLNGVTTRTNTSVVVPEVQFRIGYSLGSGTRAFVGYNMLYLSEAARPNGFTPNNFTLHAGMVGLEFAF